MATTDKKILEGIRVLSLEQVHVLPQGTSYLTDFGAEVIRVESIDNINDRRGGPYPDDVIGDEWWNETGGFTYRNGNKESLCLEVRHPKGKEVFLRLVKHCDIVCDNFRPGTMKRLGFDHESLAAINPGIITLSCTAYGHTGPWRMMGARARTIDAACGLTYLTGYEGGRAIRASSNYMDHTGGNNTTWALLLAIYRKKMTGKGMRVDVSMQESGTQSIGPAILEAQEGYVRPRLDTGHLWKSPHRVYPCKGDDKWIAITVSSDAEWQRLKGAMGNPAWAADHKLDTVVGRHNGRKEIDESMAGWTKDKDMLEITHFLQAKGVTAGACQSVVEIFDDPHLHLREYFQTFDNPKQPQVGPRVFPRRPFAIPDMPTGIVESANLGEHNTKVLKEMGGLTDGEIEQLVELGILNTRPRPTEERPVLNAPVVER